MYADKSGIKILTGSSNAVIKLYAKWKPIKYSVTYKLNGGKNSKANKTSYYITTNTLKLAAHVKKGYKFAGWYTSSKYKVKVTSIKKGSTGNKVLYARWKKVSVKK